MLRYRLTIPMMRARHSPEHAARGSLVGLFWAFTPSVGIQMPLVLISWAIARRFPKWDFNLVLAIAWTWTTNAFTALPCYYVFYLTGQVMFGRWGRLSGFDSFRLMWSDIFTADQSFLDQMQALARVLILDWGVTMLVGSLPWAFLIGWLGYRYTLKFVRAYRHARFERMKKRHQRHHAA
ncbi:DUF2062 domain-containing protein [Dongia sp.]|uniref:DUF2062 domain-containing protein n=1 Tax=Dongia sp. TaxID=1977262 RepID=UPI0035AEB1F7